MDAKPRMITIGQTINFLSATLDQSKDNEFKELIGKLKEKSFEEFLLHSDKKVVINTQIIVPKNLSS